MGGGLKPPHFCTYCSPVLHELLSKLDAIGRTHDGDDSLIDSWLGGLQRNLA